MLRDIKLAYFNGCSFTQGGGLETENDVDWNEREVWNSLLEDEIRYGIPCGLFRNDRY
jgi:hypothetical protein